MNIAWVHSNYSFSFSQNELVPVSVHPNACFTCRQPMDVLVRAVG